MRSVRRPLNRDIAVNTRVAPLAAAHIVRLTTDPRGFVAAPGPRAVGASVAGIESSRGWSS